MASKHNYSRLKREKKDLEKNPIEHGVYTKDTVSVDIMVESRYMVIMYIFNDDIIYRINIAIPIEFPFAVPTLHYMEIEEYNADGEQKIIKKPYQSWAGISPNASKNHLVLNKIDDLIASWNPGMKLRDFIPKILDIIVPTIERYQADEQAKKENAARVIQKKYTNARSWLPGQKRIAASFAPPSRRQAVYRGGPSYEAIKGKYTSTFTPGQKNNTLGGRRRRRRTHKKKSRKRKTLRRKPKSKKH